MALLPKEQRHTKMGLSRGNWITLGIFAFSFTGAVIAQAIVYGGQVEKINNNEKAITEIRKEMKTNTRQLRREIKESAKETQTILKDQMQILIQTIKSQ